MHTAATYVNLSSLLLHASPAVGTKIGVFSYGSGAASTMYRLRVRGECRVTQGLVARLDNREMEAPTIFTKVTQRYVKTYARFGWYPNVDGKPQTRGCPPPEGDPLEEEPSPTVT